jgi:hypothetical protein
LHVLRLQGQALDEVEDEDAGLLVDHLGRDAGAGRGPARRLLGKAHQAVLGHVRADPHDVAAAAVLDREVLVGHAAVERHGVDLAPPDRQGGDAGHVVGGHDVSPRR